MMWIQVFLLPLLYLISGTFVHSQRSQSYDREVVGFIYHRIGEDRFPSTNVTTVEFRAHLQFLKQNNFKVVSLGEAMAYLGKEGSHEHVVVLTIDDGYESFYKNGLPLLKEFGFTATLFVNTATVGGGSYMSWEQLKECAAAGLEIGNHTHSHAYFLNMDENERYSSFRTEIERSQAVFAEKLQLRPRFFAYPFGEFDVQMKEIVKELGFDAALAQNSGVMHSQSDFFALPRFPMASAYAAAGQFASKARMKALRVTKRSPKDALVQASRSLPSMEVEFDKEGLVPSSLQCFLQGAACTLDWREDKGKIIVKASATGPLTRRRSLCTLTIQDEEGAWHWFSHLWIDPSHKEG